VEESYQSNSAVDNWIFGSQDSKTKTPLDRKK
jgi:hypothetical protein